MHMQGEPRTMQDDAAYDDVVAEVGAFLRRARRRPPWPPASRASGSGSIPASASARPSRHNLALLADLRRLVGRWASRWCWASAASASSARSTRRRRRPTTGSAARWPRRSPGPRPACAARARPRRARDGAGAEGLAGHRGGEGVSDPHVYLRPGPDHRRLRLRRRGRHPGRHQDRDHAGRLCGHGDHRGDRAEHPGRHRRPPDPAAGHRGAGPRGARRHRRRRHQDRHAGRRRRGRAGRAADRRVRRCRPWSIR